METNTGPLGHGLPVAVGAALARQDSDCARWRIFVLTGDGELQEGQQLGGGHVGRALQARQPDRDRRSQSLAAGRLDRADDALEPLADKWRAFGWAVLKWTATTMGQLLRQLLAPAVRAGQAEAASSPTPTRPGRLNHAR